MKIFVLIKQVAAQGSVVKIDGDGRWIEETNLVFTANESDNYALEEALLMKEAHGGEVVVCTLGPERARQVVKDALAKGADRAIFFRDDQFADLDSNALGEVFARILREEEFDLILSGLQADDTGEAELGPILAQKLNLPHVTMVVETELPDGVIKVKQELEGGWFRFVEADLPALLTIQSGINKPRYASLKGIMAMKKKEIREITMADLGLTAAELPAMQSITRLYIPKKIKETTFIEGSAEEIAAKLVDVLSNEAKVI